MKLKYKVFSVQKVTAEIEVPMGTTKVKAQVPVTMVQLVPVGGSHGTIKLELADPADAKGFTEGADINVTFGG